MSTEALIRRQYINGLSFPCSSLFREENIKSGLDYKPKDGDIIVSTFPKAGTTWLLYTIYEILNDGCPPPAPKELENLTCFMDMKGADFAEKLASPRIFKYHVPYNMLPMSPKAKYISIIRNPFDVVVSYYYFLKQITDVDLQFDDLFDAFVKGENVYGDYFDHVLSWYKHRNDDNVLILSFEKMKEDPRKSLLSISAFLGRNLEGEDELVERILNFTSFDYMKRNLEYTRKNDTGKNVEEDVKVDFFRKGAVGDGRLQLTESQEKILLFKIQEKLRGTDIECLWK